MKGHYEQVGAKIGALVDEKNAAYGDSFHRSGEVLEIIYGPVIRKAQFKNLLTIARIVDKLFRIAKDEHALGENPYQDIAGYALLQCRDIDLGEEDDEN
jgi:hypothetical protein